MLSASNIYILAGLYNLSILIFNGFFTNDLLTLADNETFSTTGMIGIILWGLAYMSIYKDFDKLPLLNLVFAIEKFYYGYRWLLWHTNQHNDIKKLDMLTGLFFSIYGLGDFLFGIFFAYMALKKHDNDYITI